MAWNAPITWTPNQTVFASTLNEQLRDNMLETMPARVSGANQYLTITVDGLVRPREIKADTVLASETRTSTSFGNLATHGPAVTLTTDSNVIVIISAAQAQETTAWGEVITSHEVTGATSVPPNDLFSITINETTSNTIQASHVMTHDALNPGTHTFTMRYRVGTAGNVGRWTNREILVIPA